MKKYIAIGLFIVGVVIMGFPEETNASNPIIKERFTADPAALVHEDKVYLYTGHDEATNRDNFFVLKEWNVFTSVDMENWTLEGTLPRTEFSWAKNDSAWASQAIERNGKFYWYVTVLNADPSDPGYAIGVARSDNPATGFKDALGEPLIASSATENPAAMEGESWDDIDPTVFIDENDQAYIYWGNTHLYYAKLKNNMVEIDGEVQRVEIENMSGSYTEGPWLHRYKDKYYLSFAMNYPEELAYAMSDSPEGPWEYKGKLLDEIPNSSTSHPAIIEYKEDWYMIYHTASLPDGGEFNRSVAIENLYYNEDGTIPKLKATSSGITEPSYFIRPENDQKKALKNSAGFLTFDTSEKLNYDYRWHQTSGLAEENSNTVSFQAESNSGAYLVNRKNNLVLERHDGTQAFNEDATFRIVPGLANENAYSIQMYKDDALYLTKTNEDKLTFQPIETDEEREQATFYIEPGQEIIPTTETKLTDNSNENVSNQIDEAELAQDEESDERKSQNESTSVLFLIIVLVLAVAFGIGYLFYRKNKVTQS
ncbi:family 43 glycosylhydrolase [Saliterribacillus persicus]|uniref:Alpha-L-arabinofuranosidase B-like protein n=1 Tax=Saliterribacillus persicus TaxID=930114 RepID=A0A368Y373_9BACI|nr:family 43 glycosylhydrolase [Saliterribacillus persicus]RCW74750.1 alpha-L-arabinofuranosidase B-like protein [Saliterribacillus persicus]